MIKVFEDGNLTVDQSLQDIRFILNDGKFWKFYF
jgi:hypothetical protein